MPNVVAQTTAITDVTYVKTALYDIDTETTIPPLILNATVSYADAKPGYYLAVGVFDLDDGNLVDGLGSSRPQSCFSTTQLAGCIVPLTNLQGAENVQFWLSHPRGVWNLALVAAILDHAHDPITNSYSDYTFTINVRTALTLHVNVPNHVPVNVDGVNGSGSIQLVLAAGNHSLSVPEFVQIDNVTRLKFSSWSDGSTDTNRSVELNRDITLNAKYITQYRLQMITPVTVGGAGWYDDGSNVTLAVQSTSVPIGGFLGTLGGKWIFQSWLQDEHTISNSPTLLVTMNSPRVIRAAWRPDLRLPLSILALITTLAVFTFYTVSTKPAIWKTVKRGASNRRKLGGRHTFFIPLRASSTIFSRCSEIWS